jgi:hypothetical protein
MWDIRVYMRELKPSNKKKRISEIEIRQKRHKEILGELSVGKDPAMNLIGPGNSKKGDISNKHDSYLAIYKTKRKT